MHAVVRGRRGAGRRRVPPGFLQGRPPLARPPARFAPKFLPPARCIVRHALGKANQVCAGPPCWPPKQAQPPSEFFMQRAQPAPPPSDPARPDPVRPDPDMTRTKLGHNSDTPRTCPGQGETSVARFNPSNVRFFLSRTCPGHVRVVSESCPSCVRVMSELCPSRVRRVV